MASWSADPTYAHGTCCQPPINGNEMQIKCMMVVGERSENAFGSNSGQFSSVTCPGNSFMASCSGHSYWRSTNAWYIGEDDICYARVSDPWTDNFNTTATAIWFAKYYFNIYPFSINLFIHCCKSITF